MIKKRVIGLDFGDKTVGVALSDDFLWTARALTVVRRQNPDDMSDSIGRVINYADEYGAGVIVVGMPKNMDGSEGARCEKTREFVRRLEKKLAAAGKNIKVELYDERLTTAAANRILNEAGASFKKRGEIIDAMAAAQILQSYLDLLKTRDKYTKGGTNMAKDDGEFKNADDFDEEDEEIEIITLTDDDGVETEFIIVDELTDGGVNYVLMIEKEFSEDDESDAIIFKETPGEDGESVYEEIEDDDEFNRVADLFTQNSDDYDIEV